MVYFNSSSTFVHQVDVGRVIITPLLPFLRVEPIPADIWNKAEYSLNRSPADHMQRQQIMNTHTHTFGKFRETHQPDQRNFGLDGEWTTSVPHSPV